eukprot:NODE_5716_length_1741_cov_8.578067.p1 GENE.NODE_5716_length_1741_cov_8.578067~~NODE_5716_length_1741_cov_8.578067.p1  ORF type:complete len:379 (+),score=64.37 NODE_5716_length_1741_cov_8.578067:140-1276(+)
MPAAAPMPPPAPPTSMLAATFGAPIEPVVVPGREAPVAPSRASTRAAVCPVGGAVIQTPLLDQLQQQRVRQQQQQQQQQQQEPGSLQQWPPQSSLHSPTNSCGFSKRLTRFHRQHTVLPTSTRAHDLPHSWPVGSGSSSLSSAESSDYSFSGSEHVPAAIRSKAPPPVDEQPTAMQPPPLGEVLRDRGKPPAALHTMSRFDRGRSPDRESDCATLSPNARAAATGTSPTAVNSSIVVTVKNSFLDFQPPASCSSASSRRTRSAEESSSPARSDHRNILPEVWEPAALGDEVPASPTAFFTSSWLKGRRLGFGFEDSVLAAPGCSRGTSPAREAKAAPSTPSPTPATAQIPPIRGSSVQGTRPLQQEYAAGACSRQRAS